MATRWILGLDIGGTNSAAVLARIDRRGAQRAEVVARSQLATRPERGFALVWDELVEAARAVLARQADARIEAVGIACGGPLDSARGVILDPPHLPGWVDVPLVELAEEAFGVPAFLENDAKAGALVEWKLGAGVGTRDMIFCTMGTGFGSGIIAQGQLLQGPTFTAGEVGHLRLHDDGPVGFGKAGSVEGFCSGAGIRSLAALRSAEWAQAGDAPAWQRRDGAPSAGELAQLAAAGDGHALRLYREVGEHLGHCLSRFIDLLNPECIVLGSIFVRSEALLRPGMEAVLARECLPQALAACRIVPAETGEAIGDLAAVMAACAGLGIEVGPLPSEQSADALERLLARYPALSGLRGDILDSFRYLLDGFSRGGKLLVAGNGGSAADAEHIVGELMKGFRLPRPLPAEARARYGEDAKLQGALPAIALTGHPALSSAYLNDVDGEWIFAQQVYGLGRTGDVLLALSTSGEARNVLHAARIARARGMAVLALTGPDGGALARLADVAIRAPGADTAEVQEHHLPIYHCLCAMLEDAVFGE